MKELKQFLNESQQNLSEALITFGGKPYPKAGNILILAGGAGSGKGFILSNLVGMEGKTFDVDELKKLAMTSKDFAAKVKQETGHDLTKFNLKKPKDVSTVHELLGNMYQIDSKYKNAMFKSVIATAPDRKPNLIFDVTLKNMKKLQEIATQAEMLGYDKKNIHVVWVVNELDVAIKQNLERDRTVPQDILIDTHEGAALTMKKILSMGSGITKYLDGDIFLAFNKFKVDADLVKSKKGGSYIKKANYIKVKAVGKAPTHPDKLDREIYDKIAKYTPKIDTWGESIDINLDGDSLSEAQEKLNESTESI